VASDIVVPGSVANLGGGFDTLAVAVQLYLRVRIVDVRADGGSRLVVVNSRPPVRGRNAVERAFAAIAQRAGGVVGSVVGSVVGDRVPSVFAEVESDIPMAAGLGSSAAASIAGVRVFEHVTGPVPESTLLAVAASIDGHADNAAASLLGGMTSVVETGPPSPLGGFGAASTEVQVLRWRWPEDLRLIVATPFTGLATSKARAALAPAVSRKDAVFNLQRVLSLMHALEHGEYERLREALQDRWHQPARAALVPHLAAALAMDDPDVLGVCLSGAGPSVAVLARRDLARVEGLLQSTCEAAGSRVTVRTLAVHQSSDVMRDALASAHGRTV